MRGRIRNASWVFRFARYGMWATAAFGVFGFIGLELYTRMLVDYGVARELTEAAGVMPTGHAVLLSNAMHEVLAAEWASDQLKRSSVAIFAEGSRIRGDSTALEASQVRKKVIETRDRYVRERTDYVESWTLHLVLITFWTGVVLGFIAQIPRLKVRSAEQP